MKKEGEYLLKYIKNDTYLKLVKQYSYCLEEISNNRRDVELNIRYLLKLGVHHIDYVVLERIDDLLLLHSEFLEKMRHLQENFSDSDFVDVLENS